MEFIFLLASKLHDLQLEKIVDHIILFKNKIRHFQYRIYFKLKIIEYVDVLQEVWAIDYLWIEAKKRMFLPKLAHTIICLFCSWYSISYIWLLLNRRNWLWEDPNMQSAWRDARAMRLTMKQHDDYMKELYGRHIHCYDEWFQIEHVTMMAYQLIIFIILFNIFFILSIFSRTLHEIFYFKEPATSFFMMSIFYLFCQTWLFSQLLLAYVYHFGWGPFIFFLTGNNLALHYMEFEIEDEEDTEETLFNWLFNIPPVEVTEVDPLRELPDYDGTLHELPNIYAVDPELEVHDLIEEKKWRFKQVQPGGREYELYNYNYWVWDWQISIIENIGITIKKAIESMKIELVLDVVGETFYDFLERYFKETNYETRYQLRKERIQILSWYDPERIKFFKSDTMSLFNYEIFCSNAFPLIIKGICLLKWWYQEYKNALKLVEAYPQLYTIDKYDSFMMFFGLKPKDHDHIFRFDGGYVKMDDGLPRVFLENDFFFDEEIYNAPEPVYEGMMTQLYNFFKKVFYVIYYVISNFFGSRTFWYLVIFFWLPPHNKEMFKLIFRFIIKFIFVSLRLFFIWLPYWTFIIFCRIILFSCYLFALPFFINISINLGWWGFWLNQVWTWCSFFRRRIKRIKPSGPYSYCVNSPWKNYSLKNSFLYFKYRLFNSKIKPYNRVISKLNTRKSFLFWIKVKNINQNKK